MVFDWLRTLRGGMRRGVRRGLGSIAALEGRTLLSATAIGEETRVNTQTTFDQTYPAVATDADGDYVVTWASYAQDGSDFGIYAQRYSPSGTPKGSEFKVNSFTTASQNDPSVAMDADGDFVIVWTSEGQDGSYGGIYGQRYNASGIAQGGEFQINTFTTSLQFNPSVAMDAAGNFAVSWDSDGQDGNGIGVYARLFNADGSPQTAEFRVNTDVTGNQGNSSIAMDQNGNIVIVWGTDIQDGDNDGGISARRYNSTGTPVGVELQVNSHTANPQSFPSVAMSDDGAFVVVWQSTGQDQSGEGIYGQRYSSAGATSGTEFRVNVFTTGDQLNPTVSADANGNFVVTWSSNNQDGSGSGVYGRQYLADGTVLGGEFLVNTTTANAQQLPAVAVDDDGDIVIAWSSFNQDGSDTGTYTQRYRGSNVDNLGTWAATKFSLDSNHNQIWDGTTTDTQSSFGSSTDTPISGDWNGDGYSEIGIWRSGKFYLDANGTGNWNGPGVDRLYAFGSVTDTPIIGDWNGDGKDEIGVWRSGRFYLDLNGNGAWNSGVDGVYSFGATTDTPIIGDWNGDGIDDIGVWRSGKFYLDLNGNHAWNSGIDAVYAFGSTTDTPIIGDWNGNGIDDIGVWRAGSFYLDSNGNRAWNSGVDLKVTFGLSTDTPLIGYWRPKSLPGIPTAGAVPSNSPVPSSSPASADSVPSDANLASLLAVPTKRKQNS
ncbi:MAG: VCBS repeat-containing protein [Planctomycetaceae bacterium]|nr:VCBS repeat-containing protein [Planctomycetaceae bacterium]